MRAVGAEPGRGVEVEACSNDVAGARHTIKWHADQCCDGFAVLHRVVLAHTHEPLSGEIDGEICVTPISWWCERFSLTASWQTVDALVNELGVVGRSASDGVGGATVFMDTRSDIRAGRRDVRYAAVRRSLDDDAAATFSGSFFEPINRLVFHQYAAEPKGTGSHCFRRDR